MTPINLSVKCQLPHEERTHISVRVEVRQAIKQYRNPGEHQWQTVERLLKAGMEALGRPKSA
jgi:hypothetical protein